MKTKLLAGFAPLCATAATLCGCTTLGGGSGAAIGGPALLDAVRALSANCTGAFNANLIFAAPLPPSGSLTVNQTCGAPAAAKPQIPTPTPAG